MKRPGRTGHVRIIGGALRGRRLAVPDLPGLRPTPDRTRETLFNWLGPLHGLRALDLFAGTGALGLEACSRGAEAVVLVERDARACTALERLAQDWRLENVAVIRADALEWLDRRGREHAPFDLVFLDPPFDADLLDSTLARLQTGAFLAGDARVYAEYPAGRPAPAPPPGWQAHRTGRSPHTGYVLYQA